MGEVSLDDYYSLCGRLDTLEHVHEILVAVAARMLGDGDDLDEDDGSGEPGELAEPVEPAELDDLEETTDARVAAVADEPSGPVN